jgi:biotin carboxylase/2-polyprenyl-3-methyl-5-hydroxy-6-metoxy-1,4-benzoquinol methylase
LKILFYPWLAPGAGSGHLKRCLRLAGRHGAGAALLLEDGIAGRPAAGEPAAATPPAVAEALAAEASAAGVEVLRSFTAASGWQLVVLDRRASTEEQLRRFLPVPVLAIDEGGPARAFASYLIDALPGLPREGWCRWKVGQPPNLQTLSLLELPERKGVLRFPCRRVLVSFGGEDPADLSGALLETLLDRALLAPQSLTVVEGPFFRRHSWPPGVHVVRAPEALRQLLPEHDLVFTSFGLTTFEALAAGVPVVNLNPSPYHRRLSRAAGVPEIGVGRPRVGRLRKLLADPRPFQLLRDRYGAERFRPREEEPEAGSGYFRALRPLAPAACPVCGRLLNRAEARFPRRTYFRCGDCGVIYLLRFGGERRAYDRQYFFSEYEKQYGRTYLEDFQSIKAAARRRLQIIEQVRRARATAAGPGGGRLLDIGCALGPFLQAAAEAGYEVQGIDASAEAARYVREELGLPCRVEDFEAPGEEQPAEGSYDVISLWYVVEHFRNPAAALRRVHRLLRPGGVLALATPSASGISARRSLRTFLERSPQDHVTVWPTGAAAGLLHRLGFRLERLVVTGHHPERFPGAASIRRGSLGAQVLEGFSRLTGLGDTFEAYAVRAESEAGEPAVSEAQGKRVLILGGGVMQLPAVRVAAGLGWRVSVAAQEIIDEVRSLSHRTLFVDLRDREAVESAARQLRDEEGLDGVFTAGTDFSTTVAWVAHKLGLPGIPYECALNATDKGRMRAAFDRHQVASPRFFTVGAAPGQERPRAVVPPGFSLPLVIKPVDNMGARGVRRVDSEQELAEALSGALRQSRCGRAIVEEYLEGPELSLDAVVHAGQVTVCGVADRHIRFAPYFVEMGHTMPSELDPKKLREAEEVFVRGIRALGIREGAAKGDVKVTARGAVIGEIAARLSGGYMSGWTFPLSSGVEVTEAALRIAVGMAPGELTPRRAWVSAERAFISIPGRVRDLEGLEAARREPWVTELFLRTAAGREVELPVNNLGKCGNVISAAPSREQAVRAAETAARQVLVRLEPADTRTEAFLSGQLQGEFAAFGGTPRERPEAAARSLRSALAGVPAWVGAPGSLAGPAEALPGGQLRLLLPASIEGQAGRDWHGFSLLEAARRVALVTGLRLVEGGPGAAGEGLLLAGIFWRALLRGSVQAGIYVVDTLLQAGAAAGGILRRWEAWP